MLARVLAVRHHKEAGRFAKFLVVGTVGAVIDYGVYTAVNAVGLFEQVHLSLPLITITGVGIAGAVGFICAVISNFLWNRYWTYPDSRSKPVTAQLFTFFVVNVVGLLIRTPVIEFLHRPLGTLAARVIPSLSEGTTTWLGESEAWAIAVIIVLFWNFFVNRYWTYNDVE
jgi:putative flippase GtrA